MTRKSVRLAELLAGCAVVGMLVSLAVPSYLHIQERSRVEHLLKAARACRKELSRWLAVSGRDESSGKHEQALRDAKAGAQSRRIDPGQIRRVLERCTEARAQGDMHGLKACTGTGSLFVVDPAGTDPFQVARDGRIHIIPSDDPVADGVEVRVVVTDKDRTAGPRCDGILAVYRVHPREEPVGREEGGSEASP